MRRNKIKWIVSIGSGLLLLACALSFPWRFWCLSLQAHYDPSAALEKVDALADDPTSVLAALRDFDCYGGNSKSMSSLILNASHLDQLVESRLAAVFNDADEPMRRRVEAARILFGRTRQTLILEKLFELVKDSGDGPLLRGRLVIADSINATNSVKTNFFTPASKSLGMTADEFHSFISNTNNLQVP